MSIEAMKQALESLSYVMSHGVAVRQAKDILTAAIEQAEKQEVEPDRDCVENDGCPTEKAVLQRFWREHQRAEKQEPMAWMHPTSRDCVSTQPHSYKDAIPLYTHPPKIEQEPVAWGIANTRPTEKNPLMMVMLDEPEPSFLVVPLYTAPPQHKKLWLWKNFVNGRPEYWAFDNPYPTNLDDGDPQTLGQPCGYAIFKESRDGSRGRTEEQVLREMKNVAPPQREWQGLTDEEYEAMAEKHVTNYFFDTLKYAHAIEAKLKEKNA